MQALENIVESYPKIVKLKDGTPVTLRPLKPTDEKEFHAFFLDVPLAEHILFKHRVTDPGVIHEWCQNIDYGKILPLLAIVGDKVIADASLHQSLGGWKRHIGRISVFVRPAYRGKGLARILVRELIDIARHAGLEKVEAEFVGEQKAARRVFEENGFNQFIYLQDYVKDMQAIAHDYVLMGRDLITDEEYAGAQ
ncbi:MAG: GNAT family N-acetyltransferase [Verrucomicrobiota bacterium]